MADDSISHPSVGFYFQLQLAGSPPSDNAFKEAAGLNLEQEAGEVREGGQHLHQHHLPTVVKHPNLVLQRGFVAGNSALAAWVETTLNGNFTTSILPRDVVLRLLATDDTPVATWSFAGAWPVK